MEQVRHAVPRPLKELRRHAERSGEALGEIDLEADRLAWIIVSRIDVRPASLFVPSPDEGSAGANVAERVGGGKRAKRGEEA
jgi:hypothetical protein